jgi:uncharacterized protein with GYD domain
MANYVVLINWTEQGIGNFRETLDRERAAGEMLEKLGGRITDARWTIGPYDIVISIEAPDDEAVTAWALSLGALGNIRTTTLRAFSREEMQGIIDKTG